jgi:hypothetical protein
MCKKAHFPSSEALGIQEIRFKKLNVSWKMLLLCELLFSTSE